MENVLVTGGAGYIGSHTVKELLTDGKYYPITYDNLSEGHREAVLGGEFVHGDLADLECLTRTFREFDISAVIHFAASCSAPESVVDPHKYYQNNVVNSINLLKAMLDFGVKRIVFSSSAAVFGEPVEIPMTEEHPLNPINPYGATKHIFERILEDYDRAHGVKYTSLRYFNAAGADASGEIGEDHDPETHLIPIILDAAVGAREQIEIFGTDYDTEDGTCVRDYVHVTDLSRAHVLCLEKLMAGGLSDLYNLGTGTGNSVREVVHVAREVTGADISVAEGPRRPGDPSRLVAGSEKFAREFGWSPQYPDVRSTIESAWNWYKKLASERRISR